MQPAVWVPRPVPERAVHESGRRQPHVSSRHRKPNPKAPRGTNSSHSTMNGRYALNVIRSANAPVMIAGAITANMPW
eukprot:1332386-Rhodomonas_salina.2